MTCCTNILKLPAANVCNGWIDIGLLAQSNGLYKLELDYLGEKIEIQQTFVNTQPLSFDISKLNENYSYQGRVYNPQGQQISKSLNGKAYDCFSFQTNPAVAYTGTPAPVIVFLGDGNVDYSTYVATAGEALSGGRVVFITGGKAHYFNPSDTSLYGKALGITKNAALLNDDVYVQLLGMYNWVDNNLTPGALYYAGAGGALTTSPIGLTVLQRVGHAISASKLKISFDLNLITI